MTQDMNPSEKLKRKLKSNLCSQGFQAKRLTSGQRNEYMLTEGKSRQRMCPIFQLVRTQIPCYQKQETEQEIKEEREMRQDSSRLCYQKKGMSQRVSGFKKHGLTSPLPLPASIIQTKLIRMYKCSAKMGMGT